MLTADDIYDVLSARERLIEDGRRAARLAAQTPRNAPLQEVYLRQAGSLGLIPDRFCSMRPGSPSSPSQRPTTPTSPHFRRASLSHPIRSNNGALSHRPSRSPSRSPGRIARTLAKADWTLSSSAAAAALAATDKLLHGRGHRNGSDSSDGEVSADSVGDSDAPTHPGFRSSSDDRFDGLGSGRGSPLREGRGVLYERQMERIMRGSGGGRRQVRSPSGGRRHGGGEPLVRVPTQAFLRTWRAMKKKEGLRQQVVRFLLGTPGELDNPGSEEKSTPDDSAAGASAQQTAETVADRSAGGNFLASGELLGPLPSRSTVSMGAPPSSPHSPSSSSMAAAAQLWTPPSATQLPAQAWPHLLSVFEHQQPLSSAPSSNQGLDGRWPSQPPASQPSGAVPAPATGPYLHHLPLAFAAESPYHPVSAASRSFGPDQFVAMPPPAPPQVYYYNSAAQDGPALGLPVYSAPPHGPLLYGQVQAMAHAASVPPQHRPAIRSATQSLQDALAAPMPAGGAEAAPGTVGRDSAGSAAPGAQATWAAYRSQAQDCPDMSPVRMFSSPLHQHPSGRDWAGLGMWAAGAPGASPASPLPRPYGPGVEAAAVASPHTQQHYSRGAPGTGSSCGTPSPPPPWSPPAASLLEEPGLRASVGAGAYGSSPLYQGAMGTRHVSEAATAIGPPTAATLQSSNGDTGGRSEDGGRSSGNGAAAPSTASFSVWAGGPTAGSSSMGPDRWGRKGDLPRTEHPSGPWGQLAPPSGAAQGGDVPYAALRHRHSALSGDVQALLQRIADMRGRLGD